MSVVNDIPQEWRKHNGSSALLDIQQYVRMRSGTFQGNDNFQFMADLQSVVEEYWDESPDNELLASFHKHQSESHCSKLLTSFPWLTGFVTPDGDLTPAVNALSASINQCTRLLLRLNTLLLKAIIMSNWKLKALASLSEFNHRFRQPVILKYSVTAVVGLILYGIERKDILITALWNELQTSVTKYSKHRDFQTFTSKVADFCLESGCPAVKYDPSDDIYHLRQHLLSDDSAVREAELRAELDKLRNVNRAQQRIITNLAFRHVLEMLSASHAKHPSATARWSAFFRKALKEAQAQHERGQTNHPLMPLLRKYDRPKQIEDVGVNLYSTLSTNIHHFSQQFVVIDDQWNTLEADILKALNPLARNELEASVDWVQERLRY